MGEDFPITSWFHLKFIENNGMAFGMELWNKLVLTFGRITVVALLIWALVKMCRFPDLRNGFLVSVALIAAGAAGNIFDCVFYGVIFDNPYPPETAVLFPPDGGYSTWFEGRVVDMLYFPFLNSHGLTGCPLSVAKNMNFLPIFQSCGFGDLCGCGFADILL